MSRIDELLAAQLQNEKASTFFGNTYSGLIAEIKDYGGKPAVRFYEGALTKDEAAELGRWLARMTDDH